MLLMLLLLGLGLHPSLTDAGADAESSQKQCLEDLEALLESRLGEMVTRMQDEKEKQATEFEAKIKEMEARLESKDQAMETKLEEMEKRMKENLELRLREEQEKQAEEKRELDARNKEIESLRDLPIVFISAWRYNTLTSPQTVSFESFLANFNTGGGGLLDLDSGIFTCITPGYYAVSFSAHAVVTSEGQQILYLYKNGAQLPESVWHFGTSTGISLGVTGSRMLVSKTIV